MGATSGGASELFELSLQRRDLLAVLDKGARRKVNLRSALDVSRSTIHRAVRELAAAGLVADGDRVRITLPGRRCLELVREADAALADLTAARDLLAQLPASAPVGWPLLRDATVHTPAPADPGRPLDPAAELVRETDVLVGLAAALTQPRFPRLFRRRVLGEGMRLSMVYADALVDEVLARQTVGLQEMAEAGAEAYAVSELPFGMLLGRTAAGPRVVVIVYDDGDSLAGTLVNDRLAAINYAARLFEQYRDRAADITPALE